MDENDRIRALTPSQSFIVEAPAGSGKTELLTRRYLKLLSLVEDPEEIVALTFTKKAASEMRHRILSALKDARQNINSEQGAVKLAEAVLKKDRTQNWQLIANPSRLRIMTIDSLCMMLAYRTPILSQFGGKPDIHDFPRFLYQRAIKNFFIDSTEKEKWYEAYEKLLLAFDNKLDQLSDLLVNLLSKRDQWLYDLVDQAQVSSIEQYLTEAIENIYQQKLNALNKEINPFAQELFVSINQCQVNLQQDAPDHILSQLDLNEVLNFDKLHIEGWLAIIDVLLTKDGTWRKIVTKKQGFLSPSKASNQQEKNVRTEHKKAFLDTLQDLKQNDTLQQIFNEIRLLPRIPLYQEEVALLECLYQLLPICLAYLKLVFKETGKVDFTEMSMGALYSLKNENGPTETAMALDYKLSHLLVDEFQDTSTIQFHLIEALVEEWTPNCGKTLFLVGDPMQSIYRFRGAEVGVFLHAKDEGIAHISLESLSLKQNFRTENKLVDWVNQTYENIFPKVDNLSLGQVSYRKAFSPKPILEQKHLHIYQFENSWQQSIGLAELIQKQLKANPEQTICILVRARSQLVHLIPVLNSLKVPFVAREISQLLTRSHVIDFLSLTKALLHAEDRIAWLSLLRAPWVGLTLQDLYCITQNASSINVWSTLQNYNEIKDLSEDAKVRLKAIVPLIQFWLAQRQRSKLSHWLKGIWLSIGAQQYYKSSTLTDIQAVLELIDQYSDDQHLDFGLLEEKLSLLYVDQQCLNDVKDAEQNVQLMTIHQSKGLEFDMVIMPELQTSPKRHEQDILNWHQMRLTDQEIFFVGAKTKHKTNTNFQYVNALQKQKAEEELKRLMYVAMTRAKYELVLSFALEKDSDKDEYPIKKGSFLAMLPNALIAEAQTIKTQSQIKIPTLIQSSESTVFTRYQTAWHPPKEFAKNLPDLEINVDEEDLNWPELGEEWLRIAGIIFHQLIADYSSDLEQPIKITELKTRMLSLIKQYGLTKHEQDKALELVHFALKQMLNDERGQWILSKSHQDRMIEKAFSLNTARGIKHIILDCAFIDEQGQRWIIDYKLNSARSKAELDLEYEIQTYSQQLAVYQLALQRLIAQPVRCALYFPACQYWWEYSSIESEEGITYESEH